MEVIKTLPAVFEEFSEQRRNSFLHAYEIKEKKYPVCRNLLHLYTE